jgi:hypothetical protein
MRLQFSSDVEVSEAIGKALVRDNRKGISMMEFRLYDVKGDGVPEAGDIGAEWNATVRVPIRWEIVEEAS